MNDWDLEALQPAIEEQARASGFSVALLRAIIEVESGGDLFAIRYEQDYRWLWDMVGQRAYQKKNNSVLCPIDFPFVGTISSRQTEFVGQKMSWGPMQIMGAVARELGFRDRFPRLCGPEGIVYGAKHLQRLQKRFGEKGLDAVIAAYNAGSPRRDGTGRFVNEDYVDKVNTAMQRFAAEGHGT